MDNCSTVPANQVMMGFSLGHLVARLFSRQVILAYQPQFPQQFQRAINGREADIGIALLDTFRDLVNAQVFFRFLNDRQNHVTLGCQPVSAFAQRFVTRTHIVVHPLPLFVVMKTYLYRNIALLSRQIIQQHVI